MKEEDGLFVSRSNSFSEFSSIRLTRKPLARYLCRRVWSDAERLQK